MIRKVFILCVVFCVSYSVLGQELKYLFEKGQVMQYEHVFESIDTVYGKVTKTQDTRIIECRVDNIKHNKYEMTFTVFSAYEKTSVWENGEHVKDSYITPFDTTAMNIINFADQGRSLRFEMDPWGNNKKVFGIEELQNAVAYNLHSDHRSSYKIQVHFGQLQSRLSEEYYLNLLDGIFPAFSSEDEYPLIKVRNWEINYAELTTTTEIESSKTKNKDVIEIVSNYAFSLADKKDSLLNYLYDQPGYIHWDTDNQLIKYAEYNSIDIDYLISDTWEEYHLISGFDPDYYPKKIRKKGRQLISRIDQSTRNNTPAYIIGDISGCDSCTIVAKLPSTDISAETRVFEQNKKGHSINFSGDLPNGPDLITIYFPKDYGLYKSFLNDPRQIKIFVRPGDTIRFSVDLSHFGKDIGFYGETFREQELLNSYILGFSTEYPQFDLESLQSAINEFNLNRDSYCEEFQKWFEFESHYEQLRYELMVQDGTYSSPSEADMHYQLSHYLNFLNNANGYKSQAYKQFLLRVASTYTSINNKFMYSGYKYTPMLESIGMILSGWDKYYVLAYLTEARLKVFYRKVAQQYYEYFMRNYRGTPYGEYLESQWKLYNKFLPGQRIQEFSFVDSNGEKHSIRDFQSKVVTVASFSELPSEERVLHGIEQILNYNPFYRSDLLENTQSIRFYTGSEKLTDKHLEYYTLRGAMLVTDRKSVKEYLNLFPESKSILIILDKDQRIARIGESPYPFGAHYNLASWPQMEQIVEAPKTVNRRTLWLVVIVLILTSVFIFLMIQDFNKRKAARLAVSRKMAELELGAVRSRMNPHFLFNSLSSIQNLVNTNETEKANLYLSEFGDLVRKTLDQSAKNQISLAEELETLKTYLDLEKLRFPFSYEIRVSEEIDPLRIDIPPLFIQPHVENAIIHGLSQMDQAGLLKIEFILKEKYLIVLVEDNGPGLQNNGSNGLGKGWKLTRQRVQLLKEQWGPEISVEKVNMQEKSGMCVKFVIPV